MSVEFRNLRSLEEVKAQMKTSKLCVYPCRRRQVDPVTGEVIPGQYVFLKHKSGIQKFFAVDDSQKNFLAVSEAIAKDLESSGAPDPSRVVVYQEVSQDGMNWVPTLMYQGGNQEASYVF